MLEMIKVKLASTVQEIMVINIVTKAVTYANLIVKVLFVLRLAKDKLLIHIIELTIGFNTIVVEWLYK